MSFCNVRDIAMSTAKESLIELARTLPDECTWDEVMYQLYVRQKIEAGTRDLDEGNFTPHEEVFREFEQ
jgi:predicted transcriptional regulator